MEEKIRNFNAASPNTGYTAHFVRPNRLTPTSYSPRTLGEREGEKHERSA